MSEVDQGGGYPILLWTEFALTLLALVLAFFCPRLGAKWFRSAERQFSRLARRQALAVFVVGLAAVGLRLAVLPVLPLPQPTIADEYSHLLAAETFAQGRLTNPTPDLWTHFETLHTLLRPTYMSMYPPAPDLFLAAGVALTGTAFAGLLLSVGLMCGAICWMLQGWVSPGWAFFGGILAVLRFGAFSYWANSYWGGAVPALGGALVLGALPRILKWARTRDAVFMGVGLALLANSRPYEGLIFSLPAAVVMMRWLWEQTKSGLLRGSIARVVLPLVVIVGITALGMGFYFWRVTDSPFKIPQQVERQTIAVAPYFLWESPRPVPAYDQPVLANFYLTHELAFYREGRTAIGLGGIEIVRFSHIWFFYLGPLLTLPLLLMLAVLPYDLRWRGFDRNIRFLIVTAGVCIAGLVGEVFFFPHYAAPMTCLILAFVVLAMRQVRAWRWRGRPTGRFVVRAVPVVCLLMLAVRIGAVPLHVRITPTWPPEPYNSVPVHSDWVEVEKRFSRQPGKQLVLVHFVVDQKSDAFVYNGPNIENAKVLWAWDMGPQKDEELIRHYGGRQVWLLDPRKSPPRLVPYSTEEARRFEAISMFPKTASTAKSADAQHDGKTR